MSVTCLIHYQLDPFQLDAFREYAESWGRIIPRCGGRLLGYFMPWEGSNDEAVALIGFESLAAYESYRVTLKADAEGAANFRFATERRFIMRERRAFLRPVSGTLEQGIGESAT